MSRNGSNQGKGWALAVCGIGLLVALWWFWPRQSTQLDDNSWKIAVALYSACSRQNADQLKAVRQRWQEEVDRVSGNSPSLETLHEIIQTAEAGQWKEASQQCHELMQEQRQST